MLGEGKHTVPDTANVHMRDGPMPWVCQFEFVAAEQQFVAHEIRRLVQQEGVAPHEIAILHSENYVLDRYREIVPASVRRFEIRRQTGLEYRAVFIPQVQNMDQRTVGVSLEEDQARQAVRFYSAMTRARTWLYMTHQQKWPKVLESILPLCEVGSSASF